MQAISDVTAALRPFADWVWRSSVQASVLVLLVLCVQWMLGRRLPARWRYGLWGLVLIRLLLPAAPASRFSVFNLLGEDLLTVLHERGPAVSVPDDPSAAPAVGDDVWIVVQLSPPTGIADPGDLVASPAAPVEPTASAPARPSWWIAAIVLWAAGAAVIAGRFVWADLTFRRQLRDAAAVDDPHVLRLLERCRREIRMSAAAPRLLVTPAVSGPAVAGLWRPRLLLPPGLLQAVSGDELRLIFLHELAHLKRRDVAADWLWAALLALHWFNPLMWLARSRFRADRELARDAMVLSLAGPAEAEHYGRTILRLLDIRGLVTRRHPPAGVVGILDLAGRRRLTRRITMIAQFDRASRRFPVLAAALTLVVGCAALTDAPKADAAKDKSDAAAPAATRPQTADLLDEARGAKPAAEPDSDIPPEVRAQLDRPLPQLEFDAQPFGEVIDFLRQVTALNIFVNWRALEAAGIERTAPVSARMRNVKTGKALSVILDAASANVKLGYVVDDGVVTISTAADLRETVTRVYDIRDLLVRVTDADGPPPLNPPAEGDAAAPPAPAPDDEQDQTRAQVAAAVVKLIPETIDPDSWRDSGGSDGAIRELAGQLIVTQTEDAHRQIARLLGQLREVRGIQVTVEQRLVGLSDETVAKLERELGVKLRGDDAISYLDDKQVDALLRALQAVRDATLATAPRVTLFNGQRAHVMIAEDKPYVSGITVVKTKEGETKYEPRNASVKAGAVYDVQATVSSDRKYVTLTLRPQITRLSGFKRVPFPGAPPEQGVFTEEPQLVTREITTTVSVPDGGTLLLGGFREAGIDNQDGGAAAGPARHLYLLAKAKIIIQREIEDVPPRVPVQPAKP